MININKIMKENVTINFNMDINELNDELAIDTYTIVIPTKDIREEVSIDDLNREFNFYSRGLNPPALDGISF